jgi:hypothetical protein
MGTCNSGYSNCDGNAANGCEFAGSACYTAFPYFPSNFDPNGSGVNPTTTSATTTLNCGVTTFDSTSLTFTNWCSSQPTPTPVVQTQTATGGPDIVVLPLLNFTVASGATLKLTGNRPVVLAVFGDATIAGTIDASASGTTPGAGGNQTCSTGTGSNGGTDAGGGGGGHATAGGTGDTGVGGGAIRGATTVIPLLGGCPGGKGGGGSGLFPGSGGNGGVGGGAVQLSAAGTVTFSGSILANGSAGTNGTAGGLLSSGGGGGGGGSGGSVLVEGHVISGAGTMTVNGGAGGNGDGASSGAGTGGTTGAAGSATGNHGGGGGSRGRTLFDAVADCVINTASSCGTTCANAVNCDDSSICSTDTCVSGACQHAATNAGTVCRDQSSICDATDTCDGVSPTCPNTYAAQGSDCGYSTGSSARRRLSGTSWMRTTIPARPTPRITTT